MERIIDHYRAFMRSQTVLWVSVRFGNRDTRYHKQDLIEELAQHLRHVTISKFRILDI